MTGPVQAQPDERLPGYSAEPSFDYVPGLDGLRALSVMIVVVSHAGLGHLVPGGFGVTVFFFISGFLITRQLLAEQRAKGQVALRAFYIRRLLRLYPALLVMLAIGGSLCFALGAEITRGQVIAAIFYYTNINTWFVPYNSYPDGMYHPFAVLWSLAVEEHYYLIFPGLVFLLGRSRLKLVMALCVGIAAVTLWRDHVAGVNAVAVLRGGGDDADFRIIQGTDTRLDSILYGTVLATLLGTRLQAPLLRVLHSRASFVAGIALLLFSLLFRDAMFRDTTRFAVQGVGLFFAIGSVLFSPHCGWARALLSLRPVLILGRWSYSLYLWHSVVLMTFAALLPAALWRPAVELGRFSPAWDLLGLPAVTAIAIGLSALSYTYVEMPMVAVRRRFGSHAIRDGAPAQAAPRSAAAPSELAEQQAGHARRPGRQRERRAGEVDGHGMPREGIE